MNLGITFIFKTSYMLIMYIHVMVSSSDFCFYYFIGIIIFISNNLDIIIMQVDRFVAIFWSLSYPGLATNGRAMLICCMTKVCALVTAVLVLILDRDYLTCIKIIPLQLTLTTNMTLISGSQLCSAIVVGIVSSYLGYSVVRINKTVAPVATLGIQSAATGEDEVAVQVRRINDDPNMFYPITVSVYKHQGEEKTSSEDSHEYTTDQEARESEECNSEKRKGRTTDQSQPEGQSENTTTKITGKEIFAMAKTALNLNYIVILDSLINTPNSIMSIIYWECDHEEGECDEFLLYNKVMVPIRIVTIFGGIFICFYKLRNKE